MPGLSKELKQAILAMPSAEKDKLLLKLVAKDPALCERLNFELVDEATTLEERRDEIREEIAGLMAQKPYSPGYLMMDMRTINARITTHVKTTKDKYGEVDLTLLLVNSLFDRQLDSIRTYGHRNDTLSEYVAKRTQFILQKVSKMHPDLHLEFEKGVNQLMQRVYAYAPARYAKALGLPAKWESGDAYQ
jgi:hypothetical protein